LFGSELISNTFEKKFMLNVPIAQVNDAEVSLCINHILASKNTDSYLLAHFKDNLLAGIAPGKEPEPSAVADVGGALPFNEATLMIVEKAARQTLGHSQGSVLFEQILHRLDGDIEEQNMMDSFVTDMIHSIGDAPAARHFAARVTAEFNKARFRM
jgi:hypothetical protein